MDSTSPKFQKLYKENCKDCKYYSDGVCCYTMGYRKGIVEAVQSYLLNKICTSERVIRKRKRN